MAWRSPTRTAKALLAFAKELLCNPHTLEGCSDAAKKEIAPLAAMPLPELRTAYKALGRAVEATRGRRGGVGPPGAHGRGGAGCEHLLGLRASTTPIANASLQSAHRITKG